MQTQNLNDKEGFSYTYSFKEQEELKKIREKYEPREENKMDRLRRLDAEVTKKSVMVSISAGTIGALIMGTGMSFAMTDIGAAVGFSQNVSMVLGVIVGIIGIALACAAYPLYNYILKKERKKIAPEIIKITEELMK